MFSILQTNNSMKTNLSGPVHSVSEICTASCKSGCNRNST